MDCRAFAETSASAATAHDQTAQAPEFQFPSRDIGELRQQILEERAASWHWTESGAMTVALMHYLGRGHPSERLTIDAALTDATLVTRLEEKTAQQGRNVTGVVLELILGYLDGGDEHGSPERDDIAELL